MNDIKRGEMFYISRGGASYNGSEQHSDRPAVVVSNNKNNENSNVVEIVYMTTQPKTDLPTHVTVRSTGRISTVLCEQVYSVSTERVGTYIGECTDKEMENIDIALMISLQLDGNMKTSRNTMRQSKSSRRKSTVSRKKLRCCSRSMRTQSQRLNRMQQSMLRKTRRLQTRKRQRTQSDYRQKETHTRPCMNSYSTD